MKKTTCMLFVGVLWLALFASTMPSASATNDIDVEVEVEEVEVIDDTVLDVVTLVDDLLYGIVDILQPIVIASGYPCSR